MKRIATLIMAILCGFTVFGELTKDELNQLEDLEIAGVREDTEKDDDRNKIEVLEINTFQGEDSEGEGFRIRVVVELTDKAKNTYRVDYTGNRPGGLDSEYTGEDYWMLYLSHGDLERLKITGYAIQYGFMDDEKFLVFAEEFDGVKTMEELLERAVIPFPERIRLRHYYMYDDASEGEQESIMMSVREIK